MIFSGLEFASGFGSLLSGGFTTMAVINPQVKKLPNQTSVQCCETYGRIFGDFVIFRRKIIHQEDENTVNILKFLT